MSLKYEDWKKQYQEKAEQEEKDRRDRYRERWKDNLKKVEDTFLELIQNNKGATRIVIPIANLIHLEHFLNYSDYFPGEPGKEDAFHCYWLSKDWFKKTENKERIAQVFELPPEKYVYTRVTRECITVIIKTYRKILNLKIECAFLADSVMLKAVHDVPNGSEIAVTSKNLTDALEKLAQQIRSTESKDKIWQSDRIK